MKQFVYPAVFYYDEDANTYAVAFHDINVCTEGDSVESAFLRAKEYLESYCECCLQLEMPVEEATSFLETKDNHKKEIVLLVDAEVGELTAVLGGSDLEEPFKEEPKKVNTSDFFEDDFDNFKLPDVD